MIELVKNPSPINYKLFDSKYKLIGLSGFMRIRNEELFLERVVKSWINYLDELIIVYNDCTDNTEKILIELIKIYPKKLKVYHYLPKVYSFNTDKFSILPENSIHSFCFYSNFALSKTNYKNCVKIDGDHVGIKDRLSKIYNYLKNNKLDNTILYFSGYNIWNFNSQLFVKKKHPYSGNGDVFYFKNDSKHKFIKHYNDKNYELLMTFANKIFDIGFIFWHTHYLKKQIINNFKTKFNKNKFIKINKNNYNIKHMLDYKFYVNKKDLKNNNIYKILVPKHPEIYFSNIFF